MADSLRELVVSLSLQSDNFTRNIKSINKQIQNAESYFKLAGAGVENFEKTTEGLGAKLNTLKQRLQLQKDVVEQATKAYQQSQVTLNECTQRLTDYRQRLERAKMMHELDAKALQNATVKYEQYKNTLGETAAETKNAEAILEKAKEQYAQTGEEVRLLAGQCESLRKQTLNAADATATASTQLNKAKAAVKETEAGIATTAKELQVATSAWTEFSKGAEKAAEILDKAGKKMTTAGKTLTKYVTAPITALATFSTKSSISYESAFAGVRKTVEATEKQYAELGEAAQEMAYRTGSSVEEILAVMATGGQLGIATENLSEFTKVMIDLGNSAEDLDANEAASTIAKFINIMGKDEYEGRIDQLGAAVVELGNNMATTEGDIITMAQRIAGAGKQVGLTADQVLAFAATFSSLGIEAQMGGSAFSKVLTKMEVAVKGTSKDSKEALADFAAVAGLTSQQFAAMWENDPAQVFIRFIDNLAKMDEQGVSAIATLQDLGINEVRLRDTLLRSVNGVDLFNEALGMSSAAWEENTALVEEANKRYATTSNRLSGLKEKAKQLGRTFGNDITPVMNTMMDSLATFLDRFMGMSDETRFTIEKIGLALVALGPALTIAGKISTQLGKAASSVAAFAKVAATAGGGVKGFVSACMSSPKVITALTLALAYGAYKLADYASGAKAARDALEGLKGTANNWSNNSANTFYNTSKGLEAFNLSTQNFVSTSRTLKQIMADLVDEWADSYYETEETANNFIEQFKGLNDETRSELSAMIDTATEAGFDDMARRLRADAKELDNVDKEIEALLQKRKNYVLSEQDIVKLNELMGLRVEIEAKWGLTDSDAEGGFRELRTKLAAAIERNGGEVGIDVYQDAVKAAAEGMAAVESKLNDEYDERYALIQKMDDENLKNMELLRLNAWYETERTNAAKEYATVLADSVNPLLSSTTIKGAYSDITELLTLLTKYQNDSSVENQNALGNFAAGLDESQLAEYLALMTQLNEVRKLYTSDESFAEALGLSEEDAQMVSRALEQYGSVGSILAGLSNDPALKDLASMFNESLADEVLKISTDLDLDGAKAAWAAFAEDPGADVLTKARVKGATYEGEEVEVPSNVKLKDITETQLTNWKNINIPKLKNLDEIDIPVKAKWGENWQEEIGKLGEDGKLKLYGLNGVEIEVTPALVQQIDGADLVAGVTLDEDGNPTYHLLVKPEWAKASKEDVENAVNELTNSAPAKGVEGSLQSLLGVDMDDIIDLVNAEYESRKKSGRKLSRGEAGELDDMLTAEVEQQMADYFARLIELTDNNEILSSEAQSFYDDMVALVGNMLWSSENFGHGENKGFLNSLTANLNALGYTIKQSDLIEFLNNLAEAETELTKVETDYEALYDQYGLKNKYLGATGYANQYLTDEYVGDLEQELAYIRRFVDQAKEIGLALPEGLEEKLREYELKEETAKKFEDVGAQMVAGMAKGVTDGSSQLVSAMQSAAEAAVAAAKEALDIHSPSRVFRDEVGAMVMKGFGQGIESEERHQSEIIRNAAKHITAEAQTAVAGAHSTRSTTYNTDASINFTGSQFTIRDESDVYSLATEIAALTKRIQRGKGIK